MPCDYSEYPPDWKEKRKRILKRYEDGGSLVLFLLNKEVT